MIYQIGSGNAALDTVVTQGADYKEFFPVIPVRINNTFLSESNWPTQYVQAKKAYKKAVDGNFDKLVDALKENKNIKEMDYVFIKFGVALNVLDNSCPALHLHLPREDDGNPIREPGGLPGLEGMAGKSSKSSRKPGTNGTTAATRRMSFGNAVPGPGS